MSPTPTDAPDQSAGDAPRIQHTKPGIGHPAAPPPEEPLPVAESTTPVGLSRNIRAIGEKSTRHEEQWARTPNTTGTGAIHVKTFHAKLTDDALRYFDQTVNEWLDAHPQYEVKLVSTSVGILTGKLKEPHLICQIWV